MAHGKAIDANDEREEARRDFHAFKTLIATPGNLVAGIKLPANCILYASTSAVVASPIALVTLNTRTLSAAIGAADTVHCYDGVERGRTVTKAPGAPGTVKVYVDNGFGKPILFAQG